jgi:hypothetical protein
MINNHGFSHQTKHDDTKFHFTMDMMTKGIFKLNYHLTATNIADMMTKSSEGNKIEQPRDLARLNLENNIEEDASLSKDESLNDIELRRSIGISNSISVYIVL